MPSRTLNPLSVVTVGNISVVFCQPVVEVRFTRPTEKLVDESDNSGQA